MLDCQKHWWVALCSHPFFSLSPKASCMIQHSVGLPPPPFGFMILSCKLLENFWRRTQQQQHTKRGPETTEKGHELMVWSSWVSCCFCLCSNLVALLLLCFLLHSFCNGVNSSKHKMSIFFFVFFFFLLLYSLTLSPFLPCNGLWAAAAAGNKSWMLLLSWAKPEEEEQEFCLLSSSSKQTKTPVVAAAEKKKTLLLKPHHTHPYVLLLLLLLIRDIPTNSVFSFGLHKSCIALFSKQARCRPRIIFFMNFWIVLKQSTRHQTKRFGRFISGGFFFFFLFGCKFWIVFESNHRQRHRFKSFVWFGIHGGGTTQKSF